MQEPDTPCPNFPTRECVGLPCTEFCERYPWYDPGYINESGEAVHGNTIQGKEPVLYVIVIGGDRMATQPFLEQARELADGTNDWGISYEIDYDYYVLHKAGEFDTTRYFSPVVHSLDNKDEFNQELDKVIPEKDWRRKGYFSR